jgi:hypothetical protein
MKHVTNSSETLIKVLQESRWTCCICRNRTQGVIVHHIDEYSNSRNHNEDNLVVFMLNHHGEAHTKRDFQLNLTSKKLKEAKRWWIDFVQKCDLQAILSKLLVTHAPFGTTSITAVL